MELIRIRLLQTAEKPQNTFFHFVKIEIAELLAVFIVTSEKPAGAVWQTRRGGSIAASAANAVNRVSPIERLAPARRNLENAVRIRSITKGERRRAKHLAVGRSATARRGHHFAFCRAQRAPARVHHCIS